MDALTKGQALARLEQYGRRLTPQQFKTLRGQILAGNIDGALRGLQKIIRRKEESHE